MLVNGHQFIFGHSITIKHNLNKKYMSTFLKIIYTLTFVGFIAGIITEWLLGNRITWPAIGLFWAFQSFLSDRKIHKLEKDSTN
jgi:hypothetical protein